MTRRSASPFAGMWRPGTGAQRQAGGLGVRVFGTGDPVIVLLHGIAASQAYFGAAYDALGNSATVVVPDLLGFGSSMRHDETDHQAFDVGNHIAALNSCLEELQLTHRPILLVGHSMGASLALRWAGDGLADIRGVIAFDAPLYRSRDEALLHVRSMGWFEALFSSGRLAEAVCAWMCRHRRLAAVVAVAITPGLPATIAQDGVRHSWPSYSGSFESLIVNSDWQAAFSTLAAASTPVVLINGESDRVPVLGRADALTGLHENVVTVSHPGEHDLPLALAEWCSGQILTRLPTFFA